MLPTQILQNSILLRLILLVISVTYIETPNSIAQDTEDKTGIKLLVDTLQIYSEIFIVAQSYPGKNPQVNLFILNEDGDTVYKHPHIAGNGFSLQDFDKNGVLDIRMFQLSNVGGISELICYDKSANEFIEVKGFENYPQPKQLGDSKIWYTYHSSGCADANWGSELFVIEKFKLIELGDIIAGFCPRSDQKGIRTFRIRDNTKERIHSFSEEPVNKHKFLKKYWKEHVELFIVD